MPSCPACDTCCGRRGVSLATPPPQPPGDKNRAAKMAAKRSVTVSMSIRNTDREVNKLEGLFSSPLFSSLLWSLFLSAHSSPSSFCPPSLLLPVPVLSSYALLFPPFLTCPLSSLLSCPHCSPSLSYPPPPPQMYSVSLQRSVNGLPCLI